MYIHTPSTMLGGHYHDRRSTNTETSYSSDFSRSFCTGIFLLCGYSPCKNIVPDGILPNALVTALLILRWTSLLQGSTYHWRQTHDKLKVKHKLNQLQLTVWLRKSWKEAEKGLRHTLLLIPHLTCWLIHDLYRALGLLGATAADVSRAICIRGTNHIFRVAKMIFLIAPCDKAGRSAPILLLGSAWHLIFTFLSPWRKRLNRIMNLQQSSNFFVKPRRTLSSSPGMMIALRVRERPTIDVIALQYADTDCAKAILKISHCLSYVAIPWSISFNLLQSTRRTYRRS